MGDFPTTVIVIHGGGFNGKIILLLERYKALEQVVSWSLEV